MKTAIVHDWLTGMRGGEKVLEILCTLFHEPENISPVINNMEITTSFLQNFPLKKKYYRNYLPFFPAAVEQFDLRGFDLVLSSSHCAAKGALAPSTSCHICYCHTPLRYAWDMYHEYFPQEINLFKKALVYPVMHYLRLWDASSSGRVDYYIANSQFIAGRIEKFYRRKAEVIHPPVDTGYFTPGEAKKDFFLLVSALVPYKRVDAAVSAFNTLGLKLKIAGGGPLKKSLEKKARKNIEFLGEVSPAKLKELYAGAKAFVYPALEDFGIAPVEAQSAGTPVIGFGRGGLLETVIENKTGVFFFTQKPADIADAVERFNEIKFDPGFIREHSLKFDRKICAEKLGAFIREAYEKWTLEHSRKYS
jgi:glycosyltransferase involved in cell wall biosynthesis